MNNWKKFWSQTFEILDDILAYILTIVGILVSNYIPLLKTRGHITLELDWVRVAVAAVVALMIIGKQEAIEPMDAGARAGRRKRFGVRMFNALAQGMAWTQIIQAANV